MEQTTIADGLLFPEGPVVMNDGTVIVVEIAGPRLTRVHMDGTTDVIATWDSPASAGPNGAAVGPDGAMYVCNNGGFSWTEVDGMRFPSHRFTGSNQAPEYETGSIDRVDLGTGALTQLYTDFEGDHLCGPNDIVFDSSGGFWFTDLGKQRRREIDKGAVCYARPDGSLINRVIDNIDHPNGCGLSPDGSTLYVAQTTVGRVWAYDVTEAGVLDNPRGRCVANTLGHLDSMALEADGTVVVAALREGILVIRPDETHEFLALDGPLITNVAFGGAEHRTAYITESAVGSLVSIEWPRPGLGLEFNA
jgi:gluconolactonase